MHLKISILSLFLLMNFGSAFAMDIEKGDEQQQGDDQQQDQQNKSCGFFRGGWRVIKGTGHWVFKQLGTPTGATVVAVGYAVEQAFANFMWGFNWNKHAGASEEAHAIVQETGSMLVVAGCVVAGILIPVAVLSYQRAHPAPDAGADAE